MEWYKLNLIRTFFESNHFWKQIVESTRLTDSSRLEDGMSYQSAEPGAGADLKGNKTTVAVREDLVAK